MINNIIRLLPHVNNTAKKINGKILSNMLIYKLLVNYYTTNYLIFNIKLALFFPPIEDPSPSKCVSRGASVANVLF